MLKIQMNKLLEKEMDRKAFLKHTGIAVVVLTGVSGVVKKLNLLGGETSQTAQSNKTNFVDAYGGSAYGVTRRA